MPRLDDQFCRRSFLRSELKSISARVAVLGALLSALLQPAAASTQVRGHLDDMQVQSENAPLKEVLDALSAKFKLTYRLRSGVGRILSGLYTGSLRQVLSRILDGNDYFVETTDDRAEVVVLGASQTAAVTSANQATVVREKPAVVSGGVPNALPPLSSFLPPNSIP